MRKERICITWNGMGGELDSVTVMDDSPESVGRALVKMMADGAHLVNPGDSFLIKEVE